MNSNVMTSTERDKIKSNILLFGVCCVSFLIRIVYIITYPVQPRDCYKYLNFINEWELTNRIPATKTLPPLSMAILRFPKHYFGLDVVKSGIVINVVLGVLTVYVICLIAKRTTRSDLATIIIGGIAATNPSLVHFSCQFLRESIYLFFCSLFVLKNIDLILNCSICNLLQCALFSSAAYLSRHEGLELFVVEIVVIAFLTKQQKIEKIRNIIMFGIFCMAMIYLFFKLIGVPLNYYYNIFEMKYSKI